MIPPIDSYLEATSIYAHLGDRYKLNSSKMSPQIDDEALWTLQLRLVHLVSRDREAGIRSFAFVLTQIALSLD